MGEDAESRPPSQWHLDLQEAVKSQQSSPRVVVVHLTDIERVVSVDLGFLIRLSKDLSPNGARLIVAANKSAQAAHRILELGPFFDVVSSAEEAL